jgi:hypothetical protein
MITLDKAVNATQKQKLVAYEWLRGFAIKTPESNDSFNAAVLMYELSKMKEALENPF